MREAGTVPLAGCAAAGDVRAAVAALSRAGLPAAAAAPDAAAAFARFADLWEQRLDGDWKPPTGSTFPWAQVRLSLAALLPGFRALPAAGAAEIPGVVAVVLAGNTPLLAWPALTAALAAGHAVFVKMSRDDTLWPRLYAEALAEAAPELAARLVLDIWPGDDPRTAALVHDADAVIAYGGDAAVAALRAQARPGQPFFGFGHAISAGLVTAAADPDAAARGFARDVLTYDQAGCLSPQTVFVSGGAGEARRFADRLAASLADEAEILGVPPRADAGEARAVRSARDLALFDGATVTGDGRLRWTVAALTEPGPLPEPVGHGWVSVVPLGGLPPERLPERFGAARGWVSSVGVAGACGDDLRAALEADGVSRIAAPGEMQTPPLDWPNGGVDLFAAMAAMSEGADVSPCPV